MTDHDFLTLYQTVADITEQMLKAAQDGDWERLAALESSCSAQIDLLKKGKLPSVLPEDLRERKVSIIHQILHHDREIRYITEPWMTRLSTMMQSARTERNLSHTYGTD